MNTLNGRSAKWKAGCKPTELSAMRVSVGHQAIRERLRQDALAAWSHFKTTGLHLTEEEADAWLAKLEAGKSAGAPECHD
jgi:predicted transcriptional regulator